MEDYAGNDVYLEYIRMRARKFEDAYDELESQLYQIKLVCTSIVQGIDLGEDPIVDRKKAVEWLQTIVSALEEAYAQARSKVVRPRSGQP